MRGLLARAPHVQLVLEFLPSALARAGYDARGFLTSLTELGFRPTTIAHLLASRRRGAVPASLTPDG